MPTLFFLFDFYLHHLQPIQQINFPGFLSVFIFFISVKISISFDGNNRTFLGSNSDTKNCNPLFYYSIKLLVLTISLMILSHF